ncbi:zinc finger protein zfp-1 isoform X5 [Bicyclus anynana]|uniref:Zinc finger protein zfp-1 isoform X5 n=1 Tax=Bicyclus anynana TaxID=110368 RepID=A0ABM3M5R7_BICAN|nr:zinc finger protein zfp-1 isoform X5 [Bicyclus anynana]
MKEIMKEMVGGCCVCSDERGWPDNPLVYCDGNGCTVAVHQACYGIIAVPTGPWYCRKCESPETKGKVRCELCPSKSGALKRSDTGGWAHVVCALYIPEVRFGNVTSMEPIVLRLIPPERFNKTCYICQDLGKTHRANAGACMQCNKSGCKQQFHVTCAQSLGLLCEEAGNYLDNVKYCGYCQHHYSKLKKGGNVKTIPPYKPVSHDSHSDDSSERDGDASPAAGGATPTHMAKAKGPGRKGSHSGNAASGKNTPSSTKNPNNTTQPMDKKKPSPSRRGSVAGDGGGSKSHTPAPSPQHYADNAVQGSSAKAPGGSTPTSKIPLPPNSPTHSVKPPETVGVISSVASAAASIAAAPVLQTTPSTTSVVQTVTSKSVYQESVITNTEAMDTKQTKKRKAVNASNMAMQAAEYAANTPPTTSTETSAQSGNASWDHSSAHGVTDTNVEEKIIKKAKTDMAEGPPAPGHFSSVSPVAPPPPPPPAYSPASQPSPRHLPSPMPGPSGLNQVSNIRSPSHLQIPLPPEIAGPSPHIFHQPLKQAAVDPSHSPHSVGARGAWGGLNVAYELQDTNKPSVSGIAGKSKDATLAANLQSMPPGMRNKKRAAMATASVVSMATPPPMQATHALASVRRPPQPTPPPMYQETIKDSPPGSPGCERALKPKMEYRAGGSCTAPHMLGNELNLESGAAARLQEQLAAELAAHAAGTSAPDALVPPPLINKAAPSTITGSSRSSSSAQSLDQLLERQWEQGSQFLMEQAQHFDIASLLSCLHQLRTENVRLEEHVGNLLQRRDHLLAVNARLAIPLTAVVGGPGEPPRCSRENGASLRAPPPPVRTETVTSDRPQLIMREAGAGKGGPS